MSGRMQDDPGPRRWAGPGAAGLSTSGQIARPVPQVSVSNVAVTPMRCLPLPGVLPLRLSSPPLSSRPLPLAARTLGLSSPWSCPLSSLVLGLGLAVEEMSSLVLGEAVVVEAVELVLEVGDWVGVAPVASASTVVSTEKDPLTPALVLVPVQTVLPSLVSATVQSWPALLVSTSASSSRRFPLSTLALSFSWPVPQATLLRPSCLVSSRPFLALAEDVTPRLAAATTDVLSTARTPRLR